MQEDSRYCIYSDLDLPAAETNLDHVVPLALGGIDAFCIPAALKMNSELGTAIDGGMANDFFTLFARNRHRAKGHSRRTPHPVAKRSSLTSSGSPIRVEHDTHNGLSIWDPKARRYLTEEELQGLEITSSVTIDRSIRIRFAAKVALGSGYFVYGQQFRDNVDHKSLRVLMQNFSFGTGEALRDNPVRVLDPFSDIKKEDRGMVQTLRALCEASLHSCVIFGFSSESIVVTVGVLGTFVGIVNVPAETDKFSRDGDHDLGHVVFLNRTEGRIVRTSLREAVEKLSEYLSDLRQSLPKEPLSRGK
jgi:hypothetical protein